MPPITDTSLCPSCGFPGTPETFGNGVLRMICKHHEVCDYEDYWDHVADFTGGDDDAYEVTYTVTIPAALAEHFESFLRDLDGARFDLA